MVSLNGNPTRNGKTSTSTPLVKQARTNNNLVDERCATCTHVLIDGTCLCTFVQPDVIKNKKGEAYKVSWQSATVAHVYHDNALEHAIVEVHDTYPPTCKGYSDGSRCWQWFKDSTCNHALAVDLSVNKGERPITKPLPTMGVFVGSPAPSRPLAPSVEIPIDDPLVAIFDYGKPEPVVARSGRVKEAW